MSTRTVVTGRCRHPRHRAGLLRPVLPGLPGHRLLHPRRRDARRPDHADHRRRRTRVPRARVRPGAHLGWREHPLDLHRRRRPRRRERALRLVRQLRLRLLMRTAARARSSASLIGVGLAVERARARARSDAGDEPVDAAGPSATSVTGEPWSAPAYPVDCQQRERRRSPARPRTPPTVKRPAVLHRRASSTARRRPSARRTRGTSQAIKTSGGKPLLVKYGCISRRRRLPHVRERRPRHGAVGDRDDVLVARQHAIRHHARCCGLPRSVSGRSGSGRSSSSRSARWCGRSPPRSSPAIASELVGAIVRIVHRDPRGRRSRSG